jgi:antitoxin PrlF
MTPLHEEATVTSKGQITIPKAIRQALGIDAGEKVAFDLQGSRVVVSRVENAVHEDPAIAGFLDLLAKDISQGKRVVDLPEELLNAMESAKEQPAELDEEIEGDVAL